MSNANAEAADTAHHSERLEMRSRWRAKGLRQLGCKGWAVGWCSGEGKT
jgi:hypothetical protein